MGRLAYVGAVVGLGMFGEWESLATHELVRPLPTNMGKLWRTSMG